MNSNPCNDDLLNDCLADIATGSFREELLGEMLAHVRQRNVRRRRIRQGSLIAAIVVPLALLGIFPRDAKVRAPDLVNALEVHSAPLTAATIAKTQSGGFGLIESSRATVALVESIPGGKLFEAIDDTGLFALLGSHPAVLIQRGPFDSELVFANAVDRETFEGQ
jgi:hypothetical protein